MVTNITDIEGAQYPQNIELNKWVTTNNTGYVYFAKSISVLNQEETLIIFDKSFYGDEKVVNETSLKTNILEGTELIISDTIEELRIDRKNDEDRRKLESRIRIRSLIPAIKSLGKYYEDSTTEEDEELENLIKEDEDLGDFRGLCSRFMSKGRIDYYNCYDRVIRIFKRRVIRFNDEHNSGIATSIPLDKVTAVCIDMEHNNRSCVNIKVGEADYYIYEDKNPLLHKILEDMYRNY